MYDKLTKAIESLVRETDAISSERKNLLDELSIYIKEKLKAKKSVNLIFICTHNSRRSHMAQIWAQTSAHYFNIENIFTFSGGTQKTSFNSSAVKALKEVGFKIKVDKEGKNPKYLARYDKKIQPMVCFSKTYDHKKNPKLDFVAVMTCSDADEACPVVKGAEYRTTIKYDDPKLFDGTDDEQKAYEASCNQIGREMLYTFGRVSKLMQ